MKTKNELLNIALQHEYQRCKHAFDSFGELIKRKDFSDKKKTRIDCYSAFVGVVSNKLPSLNTCIFD